MPTPGADALIEAPDRQLPQLGEGLRGGRDQVFRRLRRGRCPLLALRLKFRLAWRPVFRSSFWLRWWAPSGSGDDLPGSASCWPIRRWVLARNRSFRLILRRVRPGRVHRGVGAVTFLRQGHGRQDQGEATAPFGSAFHSQFAGHRPRQFTTEGQPHPMTAEGGGDVLPGQGLKKGFEEPFLVRGGDSGSRVHDPKPETDPPRRGGLGADLQVDFTPAGELDAVDEQVVEDLLQPQGVEQDASWHPGGDGQLQGQTLGRGQGGQVGQASPWHGAGVDGMQAVLPEIVVKARRSGLLRDPVPVAQAIVPLQLAALQVPTPEANIRGIQGQSQEVQGLLEPHLAPFLVGDILHHADQAPGGPIRRPGDHLAGDAMPADLTALDHYPVFAPVVGGFPRQIGGQGTLDPWGILRVKAAPPQVIGGLDLAGGIAQQGVGAVVHQHRASGQVPVPGTLVVGLQGQAIALFAGGQGLQGGGRRGRGGGWSGG